VYQANPLQITVQVRVEFPGTELETPVPAVPPSIVSPEAGVTLKVFEEPFEFLHLIVKVCPALLATGGKATLKPEPLARTIVYNEVASLKAVPDIAVTLVRKVEVPVPPFAIGNTPVTPVVKGKPVALVKTAAEGVPKFGVVRVGLVANTKDPEPVSSVTTVLKFAEVGVANNVATPVPKPETPELIGNPDPFVNVTEVGVPKAGLISVGEVDNTTLPVPVDVVTPVPPFATATVPVTLVAVVAVVALPDKFAEIVPAVKLPLASLLTIVLAVFAFVAEFAATVARLILEAVEPPTVATLGSAAVPLKSPAN
jgi:hypothetical protein